jgi:hypothetical protein
MCCPSCAQLLKCAVVETDHAMGKKANTVDGRMIASPQNSISRFFAELGSEHDVEDSAAVLSLLKLFL